MPVTGECRVRLQPRSACRRRRHRDAGDRGGSVVLTQVHSRIQRRYLIAVPVEELRALYRDDALDEYIEMLASQGTLANVRIVRDAELSNGEKLPFRIERYSPSLSERGTDLALLRVNRTRLPILRLGDSETVGVGASIWSVGYPAVASSTDEVIGGWLSRDSDLEATFNPGTITSIKRNIANATVFQSNVAIYRGNSGGPTVNKDGDVIGISTWGHTSAEQIKFLVPINAAKLRRRLSFMFHREGKRCASCKL